MPSLFSVGGYKIYFWSNENNEPIHVNISKGKPTSNATKVCLTKTGGYIVANNDSKIPEKELRELLEIVVAQFFMICAEWKRHFVVDEIDFFC